MFNPNIHSHSPRNRSASESYRVLNRQHHGCLTVRIYHPIPHSKTNHPCWLFLVSSPSGSPATSNVNTYTYLPVAWPYNLFHTVTLPYPSTPARLQPSLQVQRLHGRSKRPNVYCPWYPPHKFTGACDILWEVEKETYVLE